MDAHLFASEGPSVIPNSGCAGDHWVCDARWECQEFSFFNSCHYPHRTHMQDLKDYTQDVHYENFRKKKLLEGSPAG